MYVLRSIGCGTMRVHNCFEPGRAITECCRPNTASSSRLTAIAAPIDPPLGVSIVLRHAEAADETGHVRVQREE